PVRTPAGIAQTQAEIPPWNNCTTPVSSAVLIPQGRRFDRAVKLHFPNPLVCDGQQQSHAPFFPSLHRVCERSVPFLRCDPEDSLMENVQFSSYGLHSRRCRQQICRPVQHATKPAVTWPSKFGVIAVGVTAIPAAPSELLGSGPQLPNRLSAA